MSVSLFAGVSFNEKGADGMEEMIVSGYKEERSFGELQAIEINSDALVGIRPLSLVDGLELVPSANLTTNSRGETLVFLRNAGERQTALFYDGAGLNIPWDNRLDLATVPATALSSISVAQGSASLRYGANIAGGVITLNPINPDEFHDNVQLQFQGGNAGLIDVSATTIGQLGNAGVTIAGGFLERNGQPLSRDAELPFSQPSDTFRTNTDLKRINGLVRINYNNKDWGDIAASLLFLDTEQGVAPEGRVNSNLSQVRFWRIPEKRQVLGVINHTFAKDNGFGITSTFWVQQANRKIESYQSVAYETIEDLQVDDDRAYGVRSTIEYQQNQALFYGSINFLDATHSQQDIAFVDGNRPSVEPALEIFQRRIYSISAGTEYQWNDRWSLSADISSDILQSVQTGGRPSPDGVATWNIVTRMEWQLSSAWTLRSAISRKTRQPTQRELFGTAINRFLVNPDLKPERVISIESSVYYESPRLSFTLTPFANLTDNTIDQQNIIIGEEILRQRINLEGSRGFGLEAYGAFNILNNLTLSGHVSAARLRRRGEAGPDGSFFIAERPSLLARAMVDYNHSSGLGLSLVFHHRGRAFSLTDEDMFVPLPISTSFDAELSYLTPEISGRVFQVFVRVDNFTDALIEPQFGLPASGRLLRGGVSLHL